MRPKMLLFLSLVGIAVLTFTQNTYAQCGLGLRGGGGFRGGSRATIVVQQPVAVAVPQAGFGFSGGYSSSFAQPVVQQFAAAPQFAASSCALGSCGGGFQTFAAAPQMAYGGGFSSFGGGCAAPVGFAGNGFYGGGFGGGGLGFGLGGGGLFGDAFGIAQVFGGGGFGNRGLGIHRNNNRGNNNRNAAPNRAAPRVVRRR